MKSSFNLLKKKIINKKAIIGVVGLGYVGLPLAKRFIDNKFEIVGVDSDIKKIQMLKKNKRYVKTVDVKYFKKKKKNLSLNYGILNKADIIIICLPTPLKKRGKIPDLSYLENCYKNLSKKVDLNSKLIILESTVYPGATRQLIKKFLSKFNLGINFFSGYSPERENPGDTKFSYKVTPKVASGLTKQCKYLIKILYNCIARKVVITETVEIAETSKLLENLYRSVNIGLVNELKIICHHLNIDVTQVIEAAATKNFGFQKFYPGPGLGGHCIPIDPYYLSWISKKNGYAPKILKASGSINNNMPKYIIKEILKFSPKKILLIGLSFKKNIDDDRESTTYVFMKLLDEHKVKYNFYDPYIKKTKIGRQNKKKLISVNLSKKEIKKYDLVIILTDHDKINYNLISKEAKLIVDTRGVYKKLKTKRKNILDL